jgi:LPXTG-motif cell wall-anchored protein
VNNCGRFWCAGCGNWIDSALTVLGLALAGALAAVWRRRGER